MKKLLNRVVAVSALVLVAAACEAPVLDVPGGKISGTVTIPASLKLGVLRQNHFEYDAERILDTVLVP